VTGLFKEKTLEKVRGFQKRKKEERIESTSYEDKDLSFISGTEKHQKKERTREKPREEKNRGRKEKGPGTNR